ncbi:MAG TPA: nucleotidyltransferase domain-containing protein [Mariniphaga anaerophila]|uniref:Nucleotidyltransferase domain-containing protein n=1 Tax=Mariniphaga anaerophila TaxID=1484053 RepID=A0A831LN07_9BACT|nr:nucleotidyltransferase domain-containing protein [Mariniphaga anaerophila]
MKFGLKEHTIEEIREVFAAHSRIEKAILYGSRAKGNYKTGSDIDIVLLAPDITLTELFRIENQLDDLLLPWKIDLSLFHQISNPDLIEHISRVGIVLYERGNSLSVS